MTTTVQVVLIVLGVTLIGAGLILTWRRAAVRSAVPPPVEGKSVTPGGEFEAAPASEAIEDMVNRRLAAEPGLADTRVDFGTAADGSLEIWVGDERYLSVDEIRDPRIRQAVQDAVAAYNK